MSCRRLPPLDEWTQCKAACEDDEHGREHERVTPKDSERNACCGKPEDSCVVLRIVQPLLDKDDDEECCHRELNPVCVDGELRADQSADGRARDPVELVQQRHKEHEPACVDSLRNLCRVADGEGLVTHAIDEVGLLPTRAAIFLEHGDPVEDVPPLHHEREEKGLHGCKWAEEECRCNEFERTTEDDCTHCHWVPEREPRDIRIDAVGKPEEEETRENWNRMGESCAQSGTARIVLARHALLQSHSSVCAASTPMAWSVE